MRSEYKMMQALNTDRFVKILDHTSGPDFKDRYPRYSILMEKASGSLDKFTNGIYPGNYQQVATFIVEMLEGLDHMHDNNFVHRDLKPANVLISCPKGFSGRLPAGEVCHAKIADLGLTCVKGKTCSGVAGTPLYMPPELLSKRVLTFSNDVWAMGLIFHELVMTALPPSLRQARTMDDLTRRIKSLRVVMSVPAIQGALGLSKPTEAAKLKSLIEGMTVNDHSKRLSAKDALAMARGLDVPPAAPVVSGELPDCWHAAPEPEPQPAPRPTQPARRPSRPRVQKHQKPKPVKPKPNLYFPELPKPKPLEPPKPKPLKPADYALPPIGKPKEPEPEEDSSDDEGGEGDDADELEDSVDMGDVQSDNQEEFLVVKAARAGGGIEVNFLVNWIVGDLSYEDLVGKAGHYIPKSVIPSWLRQDNYHPVEVNGIPIDTIRKDKFAYTSNEERRPGRNFGDQDGQSLGKVFASGERSDVSCSSFLSSRRSGWAKSSGDG